MSFSFEAFKRGITKIGNNVGSFFKETYNALLKIGQKIGEKVAEIVIACKNFFSKLYKVILKIGVKKILKTLLICGPIVTMLIIALIYLASDSPSSENSTGTGGGTGSEEVKESEEKEQQQCKIDWDKIVDGEEFVIKNKNGEPFMTLSAVQPGCFYFGLPDPKIKEDAEKIFGEKFPYVTVTQPYFIGQTEVTVEQYKYLMEIWNKTRPALAVNTTPGSCTLLSKENDRVSKEFGGKLKGIEQFKNLDTSNCPVDMISWQEAMYFCWMLENSGMLPKGTRCSLPTEMQFEWAARGGNKEWKKYYKYSGSNNRKEVYNDKEKWPQVKSGKPNGLKIYGMSNNIYEWCLDDFTYDVTKLKPEFIRSYLDDSQARRSLRGTYDIVNRQPSFLNNLARARASNFNCGFLSVGFRIVLLPDKPIKQQEVTIYKLPEDTKPPVISPDRPEAGKYIKLKTPAISAEVTDDITGVDSVTIKVDGKDISSNYHKGLKIASGRPTELAEGAHTVSVHAKDKAGNESSTRWQFLVDTMPPEIGKFNMQTVEDNVTITAVITDSGIGVDPNEIVFKIDGRAYNVQFDSNTGVLSIKSIKLATGIYKAHVTALDKVGNRGDAIWEFKVKDSTPPKITPVFPKPDSFVKSHNLNISAKITDKQSGVDTSSITISLDGKKLAAGKSSVRATALTEGSHTVFVSAKDKDGNYASKSWSFTVDTTPPFFTNLTPAAKAILPSGDIRFGAAVDDALSGVDKKSIIVTINGKKLDTANGENTFFTSKLFPGRYRVNISAKDNAGNAAGKAWQFTIKDDSPQKEGNKDTTPPEITPQSPKPNSITSSYTPQISVKVTDKQSGVDKKTIVIKVDGKNLSTGKTSVRTSPLKEGIHTVFVSAQDNDGNSASKTWQFTVKDDPPKKEKESEVDSTTPSISALTPENKSTVNVTQVEIGATVKDSESGISAKSIVLKVDGKKVQHRFDAASGRVSFTSQDLKPGRHKLYIYVEDVVGNKASTNWGFTVNDQKEYTGNAPTPTTTSTPPHTPAPASTLTINRLTPPNRSTVNAPQVEISATVQAIKGVISAKSIVLKVDGKKVQHRFDAAFGKVSFTSQNLKPGRHKLYIYVEDNFGNKASKIWTFTKKP